MSVNLEHSSAIPGAPSKSEISWTEPMSFVLDGNISSDFLTMPLFDGMHEWPMGGSTPGAAATPGVFDGLQQQPPQQPKPPHAQPLQHHPQPPFMNPLIEPNLFSPEQPMGPRMHQHHQHQQQPLAPKDALLDGSMAPTFATHSPYHAPMHEITSRGSISDQSQRSYGSISSVSSNSSSGSGSGFSTRRASELDFSSGSPDRDRDMEQQKRERFLERNRVAANKCRRKKKEHTRQLESRCMDVTQANSALESEVGQLRSQILELKNELLKHSNCDDPAIKAHLARMVASLSKRSVSVSAPSSAGDDAPPPLSPATRSAAGRPSTPLISPPPPLPSQQPLRAEGQAAAFEFDDMVHLPNAAALKVEEDEEFLKESPSP
ncbi:bZIP transcription factor [Aspergillus homomorphus CBS 101889]|uniref:BZIP domain-containing protein n=1 Tax=Aspergillus homomorphus (strain CBS 101889) TaxID=1450537 RepID=A0A395HT15_ASPHC|nr:hypothetical protein BO97DRAFT_478812 [Aspergillus homomorphus CBS 101889]RAL10930.1 hypothetical protein BO97DRAFT_478812 [Aspergillus homomorphus CBS 101889]